MSTVATARFEAFSLTHAQILDGTKTFKEAALASGPTPEDLDIYGVNNASIEPNSDSYTNEGDDAPMSIWRWLTDAEISIQAGYMSLPLISRLTGVPISSGGAGLDVIYEMDLWHEDSFNMPPVPVIVRMPSKDEKGVVRTATIGLYRVQFGPVTFDGPAYKDGLKVNLTGTAILSRWDEKNDVFADGKKRVGRILSHK